MEDQQSTIHVDPSGDLSLIVEWKDDDTKATITKTFVVSSNAVCLASPVWKATFDPHSPWAKQTSNQEGFRMLEDDAEALLILLDVAHLNFDRIPSTVTFSQLLQLSILCDKYDPIRLVRPWIGGWISELQTTTPICDVGNEDWLFIS